MSVESDSSVLERKEILYKIHEAAKVVVVAVAIVCHEIIKTQRLRYCLDLWKVYDGLKLRCIIGRFANNRLLRSNRPLRGTVRLYVGNMPISASVSLFFSG
jgi:hypothetical protein